MSKDTVRGKIIFHLPDNFIETLEQAFESEYIEAVKKWKVNNISEEDKQLIKKHSYAQLNQKINDVTYANWNTDDNIIEITIINELSTNSINRKDSMNNLDDSVVNVIPDYSVIVKENSVIDSYDSSINHDNDLIVFNVTQGFTLTDTANRKTVELKNFYNHFTNVLTNWVKTAAFYGVASLA